MWSPSSTSLFWDKSKKTYPNSLPILAKDGGKRLPKNWKAKPWKKQLPHQLLIKKHHLQFKIHQKKYSRLKNKNPKIQVWKLLSRSPLGWLTKLKYNGRTEKNKKWRRSKEIEKGRRREFEGLVDKRSKDGEKTKKIWETSCRKKPTVVNIKRPSKEKRALFNHTSIVVKTYFVNVQS